MAVFKCKMCGGALEINENQTVVTCIYCGSQQTLPKIDDEKKLALFNRANNLRFKSEFDKAEVYMSLSYRNFRTKPRLIGVLCFVNMVLNTLMTLPMPRRFPLVIEPCLLPL